MRVRRAAVVVAVLACPAAGATAGSPARLDSVKVRLVVAPSTALIDQAVRVRLTGVHRPKVTLDATARDRMGNRWRSRASPERRMASPPRGRVQSQFS
jgi:hypothetical protein